MGLLLCLAPVALCGVAATVAAKRLLPRADVPPARVERFAALGGVATAVTYLAVVLPAMLPSLLPHGPLY